MKNLAIVLIVIGVVMLLYTGFTYTTKEKVLDVGPLEVNKEKTHNVNWPPIIGAVLVAGGIIMLLTNKRS